jgi:hypothetical protein
VPNHSMPSPAPIAGAIKQSKREAATVPGGGGSPLNVRIFLWARRPVGSVRLDPLIEIWFRCGAVPIAPRGFSRVNRDPTRQRWRKHFVSEFDRSENTKNVSRSLTANDLIEIFRSGLTRAPLRLTLDVAFVINLIDNGHLGAPFGIPGSAFRANEGRRGFAPV